MTDRSSPPWWTLDNAAKIFPSTGSVHDSKVFRFACELREPVEPRLLQTALDKTMKRFPIYRSVLKRGWFWYYLEESALPAEVREKDLPPVIPSIPPDTAACFSAFSITANGSVWRFTTP